MAACPCASRRTATACSPSNAAACRGPKWMRGAWSCTAISSTLSLEPNCLNALTTSGPTASSSRHGRKLQDARLAKASMTIDLRLHRIVAAQPYPLLFATISGAHLYGFPSPDSDFDLRG